MRAIEDEKRWFWVTLGLSSISIVALVFAAWELLGSSFLRHADYITIHYMYVTRGIVSSLLLSFWAAWYVLRQRRASEEELRRSREHYRRLLDASPGAVVLYDRSLRVIEWNETAERTYGYSKAEVLGQRLPTVPEEVAGEWMDYVGRVERNEPVLHVETVRRDKDGEKFEVEFSLLPFHDIGGEMRHLEVTQNIRERVRMREQLVEIEKLTSMGRMAAGTAHHLNTPLAAMLLRVQMMRDRVSEQQTAADLERLEGGIHFCQHFVRRLLDFARPNAQERQSQDLRQTIESVVSFLSPSIEAKHAAVTMDPCPGESAYVLGDRNLLEVLITTLLSNALDSIPDRGTIGIQCRVGEAKVELRIRDNGCGIKPENLERVFEPFFTTKGTGRGTGLGLAIARNIVVEHGGTIQLESRAGEGATAVVELPLYRVEHAVKAAE